MRTLIMTISMSIMLSMLISGCGYKDDMEDRNDKSGMSSPLHQMSEYRHDQPVKSYSIGSHKGTSLVMSEEAANHVSKIKEVEIAYVIFSDHQAYVGVSLESIDSTSETDTISRSNLGKMNKLSTGEHRLQQPLIDQVIAAVKEVKPSISHVYVSASPEFIARLSAYRNEVNQGVPLEHYVAEFNAMAERIFPVQGNLDEDKPLGGHLIH